MNIKKKKIIKLSIIIVLLVLIFLCLAYVSVPFIKYIKDPQEFKKWIDDFGIFSSIIFILITISSILFPIIPGEPLELAAGYAFGFLEGSIYCLLAESLGSIIIIMLTRKFGLKIVRFFIEEERLDSLKFLKSSKRKTNIFSILFIAPGVPKDLLCFYAGLSDMDLLTILLITSLGRLPSILSSTIVGAHLSDKNYTYAAIIFVVTGIISLICLFLFNGHQIKQNEEKTKD